MTQGRMFLQFVNELKSIDFPIDKVSGGDIQAAFNKYQTITEAVQFLHNQISRRQMMKKLSR